MHEETKTIGTTGPEMRRFFFTIDHAVQLVKTAMDNIDLVQAIEEVDRTGEIQSAIRSALSDCESDSYAFPVKAGSRTILFLIPSSPAAIIPETARYGLTSPPATRFSRRRL
jgi:hypothetical protein